MYLFSKPSCHSIYRVMELGGGGRGGVPSLVEKTKNICCSCLNAEMPCKALVLPLVSKDLLAGEY